MTDFSISVAAFFISRIKVYGTSCERKDMKTNQIMVRPMGDFKVTQRTKDAFFNATDLLKQWNQLKGMKKEVNDYFDLSSTKEFIYTIAKRENYDRGNYPLENKYMYRDKKKQLRPYAEHVPSLFQIKDYENNGHTGQQVLLTPKGKETFRLLVG